MPVLEMPSWGMVALALTQAIAMLALAPLATGFNRVLRAKMHSRQGRACCRITVISPSSCAARR